MNSTLKKQSNPFSTGGGGVNFESRVQASFAIVLLTRSCIPCLPMSMRAIELKFQNKYDDVHTDDFVLVASDTYGTTAKLYAQIKHSITISTSTGGEENSSTFNDVIKGAWEDFKKTEFNQKYDAITLITGPLTQTDVVNTLPILEWARYSASSEEFLKKIHTPGFTSAAKLKKLEAFKVQLTHANDGIDITNDELWKFLRIFYLISFDLDAQHSIIAHLLTSLLQLYTEEIPSLILSRIITCVQDFNQNAGSLTFETFPEDIKELFNVRSKVDFENDFLKLQERGNYIRNSISSTIQGYHVNRDESLVQVSEAFNLNNFVFVTGGRGTGKSGIVKDFLSNIGSNIPVFYIRAEDLDKSHLNDVFASFGMNSTLSQIEGYFALIPKKILVIESVEKVLELNNREAFNDLLQFVNRQTGWVIIATGRDYAFQQLCFNFLQPNLIKFSSVFIESFSKEQVLQISENIPELKKLIANPSLLNILAIPFFIEITIRAVINGAQFRIGDNESDFRRHIWNTIISGIDRRDGIHIKRRIEFIKIAVQRAKKMQFGVDINDFDPEIINKLEVDGLINQNETSNTISLVHDVLEDWALEDYIESKYQNHLENLKDFLVAVGNEPAMSRAFRLWLYHKLQSDDLINDFISNIISSEDIDSFWKDETIAAILQYENPRKLLNFIKYNLLKENCALLIRFCFILRITCQRPDTKFSENFQVDQKTGIVNTLFLKPYGNGWESIFSFIADNKDVLTENTFTHIIELIFEWSDIINIHDKIPNEAKLVGSLVLWLLEQNEDSYEQQNYRKKILETLLRVAPEIQVEFELLLFQEDYILKDKYKRRQYIKELANMIFLGYSTPFLCKYLPDVIVKLAKKEWFLNKLNSNRQYFDNNTENFWGLNGEIDFFPASGFKGPFKYLLDYHPNKALEFILSLCNYSAKNYADSNMLYENKPNLDENISDKIILKLNNGNLVEQYAWSFLWTGYRGYSNLPYLLQCALMALENWLIEWVEKASEKDDLINWIYLYLLEKSNSIMITSVLASVAVGFPNKIKRAIFPILNIIELYALDISRFVHERGENEYHWFGYSNDMLTSIYIDDRRKAALRPWRQETLETLLVKLQLDLELRDETLQIVDNLKNQASIKNERRFKFLVNRIDTRTWQVIEDKENDRIIFENKEELPEDLRIHQQKFKEEHDKKNSIIVLNLWSRKIYEENYIENIYFSSYKQALNAAKDLIINIENNEIKDDLGMGKGAIAITAAVCIRDDFENLDKEDRKWCFKIIIDSIVFMANAIDSPTQYDKTDHLGACACAYVLPKLFKNELDLIELELLKQTLAIALTHVNINVCISAAKGIRVFLWNINSTLALNCLRGGIEYSKFQKEEIKNKYYFKQKEITNFQKEWRVRIDNFRQKLINGELLPYIDDIDYSTHSMHFIHLPMLMIKVGNNTENEINLIKKIVNFVFISENQNYRSDDERRISIEAEKNIKESLVEHLVYSKDKKFTPFKDLIPSGCFLAPSFMYSVKLGFDVVMEKENDFKSIWNLWKAFEPALHKIALMDGDRQYRINQDVNRILRGCLYTDTPWQGHESDRACIEYGAKYLLEFFNQSAHNVHVFEALSSLIYNFYDLFFHEGIPILANTFLKNSNLIVGRRNTSFYLEISISKYLLNENRGMLSKKMYKVCLVLLAGIIDNGSARAYYLREHLIRSRKIIS